MMKEFAQHMADVFRLFGPITLRRMFAGYGIFRDGIMFGLVYDDTLYLKADAENAVNFQRQGLGQFEYARQGKIISMSYYRAPEPVLEDPDELGASFVRSGTTRGCVEGKKRLASSRTPDLADEASRVNQHGIK
jgi:DNA transformation protein and related proteins